MTIVVSFAVWISAIFFGIAYAQRVHRAGGPAAMWGLIGLFGYGVVMQILVSIIFVIAGAVGLEEFGQTAVGLLFWYIVTLAFAGQSDKVLEKRLAS